MALRPSASAPSANWRDPAVSLVDVPVFGETAPSSPPAAAAMAGQRRSWSVPGDGAARRAADALHVAEVARTTHGTLALRGPLVPKFPLPFEIDLAAQPAFAVGPDGFDRTPAMRAPSMPRAAP